jgi:hypothetical protein
VKKCKRNPKKAVGSEGRNTEQGVKEEVLFPLAKRDGVGEKGETLARRKRRPTVNL